jgi:polyadenylate-binding protein
MMPQMGPMGPMMGPMGQMPPYMPPHGMMPQESPAIAPILDLPNDKELLGERLYPLVERKNPTNASKITGMLLEMEIEQIQNIIRDPSQLDKWISEAMKVIFT